MHQLENTLYLMTQGAYLHLDHDTLRVEIEKECKLQIPLHHLGAIFCFGNILVSPFLIHRCAEEGRLIVWLTQNGRFRARSQGPTQGNVLLRQAQFKLCEQPDKCLQLARNLVAGKIKNSRQIILRAGREAEQEPDRSAFSQVGNQLARLLEALPQCLSLDEVRGTEGDAARLYYSVFDRMLNAQNREAFPLDTRNRRPPRDPINALLSFLYTMLTNDVIGAIEGVGLDPQVGFLHALRPGKPALALDLVEELRAVIADRLALTLINRKQITLQHFEEKTGGAVLLNEEGRKEVVVAYQTKKQDELHHPLAEKKMPLALIPHYQARVMARYIRGDLDDYVPFLYR